MTIIVGPCVCTLTSNKVFVWVQAFILYFLLSINSCLRSVRMKQSFIVTTCIMLYSGHEDPERLPGIRTSLHQSKDQ